MSVSWYNGATAGHGLAEVSLHNRGLTLGDGAFETVLVVQGVPVFLPQHLKRLERTCEGLGIDYPAEDIAAAIASVLAEGAGLQVLRLSVTRGETVRGLAGPSGAALVFATLNAFAPALIGQGAAVVTADVRRHSTSFVARHKTLSYVDAIIAARAATAHGADDALMLNEHGHVACCSIGNIFLVRDGRLITPSLDQGILPGITRQVLLDQAGTLGLKAEERAVQPDELRHAESIFSTNSLRLVRPVTSIDGIACSDHHSDMILNQLAAVVTADCGHDPRHIFSGEPT